MKSYKDCGVLDVLDKRRLCQKCKYKRYRHVYIKYYWKYKESRKQYQIKRKDELGKNRLVPCSFCGFIPIHRCQMDWDHIDGNRDNNDPLNLQVLCSNCHRLKTWQNNDNNRNKYIVQ